MTTTATPPTPQPKPTRKPSVPRPDKLPSEVLIERGWCKEALVDRKGHVCLIGSLNVSLLGEPRVKQGSLAPHSPVIWKAFLDAIEQVYPITVMHIFNDAPTTTFDDVLAVAREAERRLGWRAEEVPA